MTEPVGELADGVRRGDRRTLARAITLIESTRPEHRQRGIDLIEAVLAATGGSVRLAVTGAPGVGKSTFIEALGVALVEQGHRVAVLAIDPSSLRSGGSILGDKTRMDRLANQEHAFVRPSPSGGTLGGTARRTREALLLCEAAGFDVVIVETVGVGQSETAAAQMVDCFVLLAAPGGGDELQGIKRGIMELADVVVVNKADGELAHAAQGAAADLARALQLVRPNHEGWKVPVLLVSAVEGRGVGEVWSAVGDLVGLLRSDGRLEQRRGAQAGEWMWSEVRAEVLERFLGDPAVARRRAELEAAVVAGAVSPGAAAQQLLS